MVLKNLIILGMIHIEAAVPALLLIGRKRIVEAIELILRANVKQAAA